MAPNYDFACDADHVFEVFLAPQRLKTLDLGELRMPCAECGEPAKWKPSVQVQPEFKPTLHEHLGPEPVLVESRDHYRRLLEARDAYGPYREPDSKSSKTTHREPTDA